MSQQHDIQRLNKPVRVRLYGKALAITRGFIKERQGSTCKLCKKEWTEIDHIDGNTANNDPSNLRGLCKRCNIQQRNLQRGDRAKGDVYVPTGDEDSMEKNLRTEQAWVEFIVSQLSPLNPGVGLPKRDLTGNSAFRIGLSVATIERHWKKYASDLGPFLIFRPEQGTRLLVRLRR